MKLSDYEKAILAGEFGKEAQKIVQIMIKIAEINHTEDFVDVSEVMLASTQNMSIGGVLGMEFLTRLADSGIRFKAKTITDPVSIDLESWQRLNIPVEYARQQEKSVAALIKLGAVPSWTCTPYLAGSVPRYGEHLTYVETSCVIFANSFFGARTNREMDISALASAITGKTPRYGLHLAENREGELLVNVEAALSTTSDYDALGNYVGKIAGTRTPVFKNIPQNAPMQGLMQLGAALATTGAVPLFHIFDITPDIIFDPFRYGEKSITDEITITESDMQKAYEDMNTTSDEAIDFVSLGCPHYTIDKIKEIAAFLEGKKVKENVEVWICTSKTVRDMALRSGEIQTIEASGAKVVIDTCMVLAPVQQLGFSNMATDSAKAQFYVSGFGIGVRFGNTIKCLETAVTGKWEG
ncbi:aconitase X [Thermodesulfobacteriota bacterium]